MKTVLFNEIAANEWDKVQFFLNENKFINNERARELTGIKDKDVISKLFKKWVKQGLLLRLDHPSGAKKLTKYKLAVSPEVEQQGNLCAEGQTNKS